MRYASWSWHGYQDRHTSSQEGQGRSHGVLAGNGNAMLTLCSIASHTFVTVTGVKHYLVSQVYMSWIYSLDLH